MALKRALVVDDSKVARVTLQKQLEAHNLAVEMAASGEEALEFLSSFMVDVVFMDHEMPGMNGLEAVKAIKSNPRTAMIPVMMYTAKGGELYVSQARALGAVDLLPKQTEPGVLFNMLLKLGLVIDRRHSPGETESEEVTAEPADAETTDTEHDETPVGMQLSGLLARMLEDQHLELRSELQRGFRYFAKQVASEIHDRQEAERDEMPPQPATPTRWPFLTGALAIALLSVALLFFQARSERDVARQELGALTTTVDQERLTSLAREEQLAGSISEERARSDSAYRAMLDALSWSMNQAGATPYTQPHLNDVRADQLRELRSRLLNAGFTGTVRVEAHLGEFCLVSDIAGNYQLADPDASLASCAFIGHPLDNSNVLSDRLTPGFASFLAEWPNAEATGIELEFIARQRADSVQRVPYPAAPVTAGEWNRVAAENNRVEFSLLESD
ncbi:MAG: response regulator [Woeseiaceae bacterium]|nr:response regulator [Woeseiaceae bacterium]